MILLYQRKLSLLFGSKLQRELKGVWFAPLKNGSNLDSCKWYIYFWTWCEVNCKLMFLLSLRLFMYSDPKNKPCLYWNRIQILRNTSYIIFVVSTAFMIYRRSASTCWGSIAEDVTGNFPLSTKDVPELTNYWAGFRGIFPLCGSNWVEVTGVGGVTRLSI